MKITFNVEYFDFLKSVRQNYINKWNGNRRQDPYKFGFNNGGMTPIEHNVWCEIRYQCVEMYPQFPVGKYYLDFANPYSRIAIEVDGRHHLTPERQRQDYKRTQELKKAGWTILRVPGWLTYRSQSDVCQCESSECGQCNGTESVNNKTIDTFIRYVKELITPYPTVESSQEIVWLPSVPKSHIDLVKNKKLFGYKIPNINAKYHY